MKKGEIAFQEGATTKWESQGRQGSGVTGRINVRWRERSWSNVEGVGVTCGLWLCMCYVACIDVVGGASCQMASC